MLHIVPSARRAHSVNAVDARRTANPRKVTQSESTRSACQSRPGTSLTTATTTTTTARATTRPANDRRTGRLPRVGPLAALYSAPVTQTSTTAPQHAVIATVAVSCCNCVTIEMLLPGTPGHRGRSDLGRETASPRPSLDFDDRVARDLRRQGYAGRTLVLRLRDSRFHTMSKQRTLSAATNATHVIYEAALALLDSSHRPGRLLRLLGLTMSGLTEARQTALDDSRRDHACDEAVDLVRSCFGSQALRRADAGLALGQDRSRSARGRGEDGK